MADDTANWLDFSKRENRKAVWRTSRKLMWTLIATLAINAVFLGVNPFNFWATPLDVLKTLGMWIVVFHIFEAVRGK